MGIGSVLFVIFLVLKLTGLIAWSWWWVTAPIWMPFVFVIVVWFLAFFGVSAVCKIKKK